MFCTVVSVSSLTNSTGTPISSARPRMIGLGSKLPVRIRHLVEVSRAANWMSGRSPPVITALLGLRRK